jgi:hypothetical protein
VAKKSLPTAKPQLQPVLDLQQASEPTKRVERHWICGRIQDLDVYRVPAELLYFNVENGRYADKMLRLKADYPGVEIDPREEKWKSKIEGMLAGEHLDTARDASPFQRLKEDVKAREQLRPGVVLPDGGVIDGNRRLAALRRLAREEQNPIRYRYFDAVILPANTTQEDRWRIEAGLQLSVNERWDYPPVNELLKVRQGLKLYEKMISDGVQSGGQRPADLVAKAIYGKSEADILEMQSRLELIDEYLEFIKKPGAYDQIGESSEDFLEARKIITAAENHQKDPKFIARLKATLFYVIHREKMDNYELRAIYDALGGDPRRRGRKKKPNPKALDEFLAAFPDPRIIRADLTANEVPSPKPESSARGRVSQGPTSDRPNISTPPQAQQPKVDPNKAEAGIERFKRKMEADSKSKSVQAFAEGALADLQSLQKHLSSVDVINNVSTEGKDSVRRALHAIQGLAKDCLALLR